MIAHVELKDAKGETHEVQLLVQDKQVPSDGELVRRALDNLKAWAEHGTHKGVEPYELVSVEVKP